MPRVIEYTEGEGSAQTSATTVMQLINQSKSATAGMAGFAIKSVVVSSTSAVIFGLASSMLATGLVGPGLSFLGGAGFGFVGGLVHRWRTDVDEAIHAVAEFPELMEHHIRLTDTHVLRRTTFEAWRRGLERDYVKQGYAVGALYSAAPAIQRIREVREEELITAAALAAAGEAGEG